MWQTVTVNYLIRVNRIKVMPSPLLSADIGTARLLLRRPELRDLDGLYAIYSDPEVARWLNWMVYTDKQALWADIEKLDSQWREGAEYYWVIEKDGLVVGSVACGVKGHDADLGFMVGTGYCGNGYATEAVGAVLKAVAECGQIERVVAIAATDNVASIAVLEKLAMQRKGIASAFMRCPNISDDPVDAVFYTINFH
jgi:RimJ/RimL family protein N-acetyltransferase